jgi:hypothetical protein
MTVGCICLWIYGKWAAHRVKAFIDKEESLCGRDQEAYEAAVAVSAKNPGAQKMTTV